MLRVLSTGAPNSRRAVRVVRRGWHARVEPRQGQREACGGDTVAQGGECVEQLRPYVQGHHMRRMPNFGVFLKHMGMSARRQDTRDGRDDRGAGITSAQHPMRETPKAVHDSYPPAIIRTASPNLHIEPRRRSERVRDSGALSLSRQGQGSAHTRAPGHRPPRPAPVAQWIEQAPSKRLAAGSSPAGGATQKDGVGDFVPTLIPFSSLVRGVLPVPPGMRSATSATAAMLPPVSVMRQAASSVLWA